MEYIAIIYFRNIMNMTETRYSRTKPFIHFSQYSADQQLVKCFLILFYSSKVNLTDSTKLGFYKRKPQISYQIQVQTYCWQNNNWQNLSNIAVFFLFLHGSTYFKHTDCSVAIRTCLSASLPCPCFTLVVFLGFMLSPHSTPIHHTRF